MTDSKISPFSSPKLLLARLSRLTSTVPGLDASLMLAQYSSPLVIALLLKLAAFKARHPKVTFASGAGKRVLTVDGGFGLAKVAEGWGKAAGSIGDARVVMRAFGLLPIIQWILSLHPKPLAALKSLLASGDFMQVFMSQKTLPTLQALAILFYYPLEHVSWLGSKGVLPISPSALSKAALWSVRFWAVYVVLEIHKLCNSYRELSDRTRALQLSRPEVTHSEAIDYEFQDDKKEGFSEKLGPSVEYEGETTPRQALANDWKTWKRRALVNGAYAPLTIHWSTPGGLWSNPLITGTLGSFAAIGSLMSEWNKGDTQ
ncbi:hypothetical protein CNG01910 [Cryptococcus deneoformans JEC21]|uniref:Uncharacterized protein n=1 Tax=Cryptococcus deneoformans (strain JEC21 / ATCC MYA-565) TaxID=214684 RepID=Q5KE32_CRYD1|nr:hypothetical protein CNG01910 [Cryptococcus neoformans var. neoformans JEC21]AAW44574.2 hypothetical protein CNG01910 [Cryptococcus neoformans var. neoformans JEC21]